MIEVIKISKMLSGKELAAFEELICVADIADSANYA